MSNSTHKKEKQHNSVDDSTNNMNSPLPRTDDGLSRTIDNFINICENASDFQRHRERLNIILNDLNSIEFQHIQCRDILEVSTIC